MKEALILFIVAACLVGCGKKGVDVRKAQIVNVKLEPAGAPKVHETPEPPPEALTNALPPHTSEKSEEGGEIGRTSPTAISR
jgi:hypothetical protein